MNLFEPEPNRRNLSGQALWFGLWASLTTVGLFLHPSADGHGTHTELGLPPCPSVLFFDRPCPGCGLTTSWSALLHGDFALAFHAHPLGPIVYAAFTASAIAAIIGCLRGARLRTESRRLNWAVGLFAVAFLTFGLCRMALTPHFATGAERAIASAVR